MTAAPLPLSKYLDPADFAELAPELEIVDRHFVFQPQSEFRRWEYAMGLRAARMWQEGRPAVRNAADVGGAGSAFWQMLGTDGVDNVCVIDPDETRSLDRYLHEEGWSGAPRLFPMVFCISVLEHVPQAEQAQFLYHLSCLTAPGGLLFLTGDACSSRCLPGGEWDHHGQGDPHHFHWMRPGGILTTKRLSWVLNELAAYQFSPLGIMLHVAGPSTVYDYTFVSIAMVKRR